MLPSRIYPSSNLDISIAIISENKGCKDEFFTKMRTISIGSDMVLEESSWF